MSPAVAGACLVSLVGLMSGAATRGDSARERCDRGNDLGLYRESLSPCAEAVAAARSRPAGRADLAAALTGHGLALEMTGARAAAEAAYLEALHIHRELAAGDQQALVLSNLAALAIGGGDYGRALAWLAEEEAVARSAGDALWVKEELRIVGINRAVAFEQLGAYREALTELRSLPGPENADAEIAAAHDVNLAVLYRNLGDPRRALRLLDSAAARYESLGDRAALANVHLNRGLVLALNLEEPEAARRELGRALELARAAGDSGEELRTLQAQGELEIQAGALEAAARSFSAALAVARGSAAAAGEWAALTGLGRVESKRGKPTEALALLREAARVLERASSQVANAELAAALLNDQRLLYATAIDVLGERALAGEPGAALEALVWSERWKARELLAALGDGVRLDPLGESELADFGARVGPAIAYFAGEKTLWRWSVGSHGVALAAAGASADILARAARARERLARGLPPPAEDLAELGRHLLPSGTGSESALLRIAPDGLLHYLPFQLLNDPDSAARRLIDARPSIVVPSLSVLSRIRDRSPDTLWRLAAVAAPAVASATTKRSPGALLVARHGLPPLPGAAREADSAADRLGGRSRVFVGNDATETRFRQLSAEGAGVLHIAAHTIVDESLGAGVAIFLAEDDANDGLLAPPELARLTVNVDLVVLSGCRTALPAATTSAGRSLSSLSGALLAGGARGVLASLWEVGDQATATLMDSFYFELARGRTPAEALRKAQLRLASDPRWSAPHLWAGFVLTGDPPAIGPSRRSWPWLLLACLAGFAAIAFGARRSRPRRSLAEPPTSGP